MQGQAPFYHYNTAASASNQTSYDMSADQGTWQQPDLGQTSSQQDGAYYTGVISGAPQSYYTGNAMPGNTMAATGNTMAATGSFATEAKTAASKTPKDGPGNASMTQTPMPGTAQYGSNMSQYLGSNQFQENYNTMGMMNNNAGDANYYGYSGDQNMANPGNGVAANDSYNNYSTVTQGVGNSCGGMGPDNSGNMNMGSNPGVGMSSMGNHRGSMGNHRGSMGNHRGSMATNNMRMGTSGAVDMAGGSTGTPSMNNTEGMGMTYKGGGAGIATGGTMDNQCRGRQNMGMGGTMQNSSQNYNDDHGGYNSDYHGFGNQGSNHGNFIGRGNRFQNQQGSAMSGSRGGFNNWSQDNWKNNSGYRNSGGDSYRRGGRGYSSGTHYPGREMNRGPEAYHTSPSAGRGSRGNERSVTIHLDAAHFNLWCHLRKKMGKRDSELAEHLLDLYEQCSTQRNGTERMLRKRKVSPDIEGTPGEDQAQEELTEEERQMKQVMGFAGFKTSKGTKPNDISFSAMDCGTSSFQNSKKEDAVGILPNTTLTPEERRAMASLGGFSVFTKADPIDPASVGFGAPAITFTEPAHSPTTTS